MTIGGHPEAELIPEDPNVRNLTITVCANCERIRTVLFLSGDRWFCTSCRAEGDARPTMIPMTRRR